MVAATEGFRLFTFGTISGKINGELPFSPNWGMRVNEAGAISVKVRPLAEELAALNIKSVTTPLFQCIGVAYGSQILEAGPIWSSDYADGELSIGAGGIWTLLDKRKAVKGSSLLPGAKVTETPLTINGSLADIARELVRISIEDNPYGVVGHLNIVLPELQGGTETRTYQGYELGWIGARLRELTAVDGGPDIRFKPRFRPSDPSVVEWVMEVGTKEEPLLQQAGSDWTWDGSAPDSGVIGFNSKRDAEGLGSKVWAPGAGQERAMKLATQINQNLIDAGAPWTEVDEAGKDVESMTDLQRWADGRAAEAAYPWDTFSIKVRANQAPVLGTYRAGDWAEIIVPENHPTLDPGKVRVRIMAIDGDDTNTVALTVSPVQDTEASTGGDGEHTVDGDSTAALPGAWTDQPAGTWAAATDTATWNEVPA